MGCYAIGRVASYKFGGAGGVLKEALRTLANYDNPDCNPELSYLNVALVEANLRGMTPEKYILWYREVNNIKGRFNTSADNPKNLTNALCQAVFTASSEFFEGLSREEQIEFFKFCFDFFKKEFPSVHIVSAIIHYDETTPHMHITFLPTVERKNKKSGELETIFSTTTLMPGKDYFRGFQNRFYEFISARYDGFERGSAKRKHLSVEDYKDFCKLEQQLSDALKMLDAYKKAYAEQKKRADGFSVELDKLKNQKRWFESIPLFGEFFKRLRNMKIESIEYVLRECIEVCKQEEEFIRQQETGVDGLIALAAEKSKAENNPYRFIEDLEK